MLVKNLLSATSTKLVTIPDDASLIEAAKLLRIGTDLIVVCNSTGGLVGVITKTDVVSQISHCQGASCIAAVSLAMARDVVVCHPGDWLYDVWRKMKERGLKNIPVTDQDCRPIALLNVRDTLQGLLKEVEDEEALLRDYVMSVGYR